MSRDRDRIYRQVRTAIARGELVRPEVCERCGLGGVAKDGRSRVQAHHHDYDKPLEVEWLCADCHIKTHGPGRRKTEAHGTTNRYTQGCRCEECRRAKTQHDHAGRRARAASGRIPHGTANGYQNWLCRCDACKAAHAESKRAYWRRRRDRELERAA